MLTGWSKLGKARKQRSSTHLDRTEREREDGRHDKEDEDVSRDDGGRSGGET